MRGNERKGGKLFQIVDNVKQPILVQINNKTNQNQLHINYTTYVSKSLLCETV